MGPPALAYLRRRMIRRDELMAKMDEISEESRFFFVHVQKAAGTALFRRLKRHFGERAVYPNPSDGDIFTVVPQLSIDVLRARWHQRHDEIRVVTGHFPLCTTELLGGGFTTITVLREPVERTLSYLRHHRNLTPSDHDKSLEAIYEDQFRFQTLVHNHMVKMFSLTTDEMTDGALTPVEFTPMRLDRAKRQLVTLDLFGLQERFNEFCEALTQRFGWQLGDSLYANRTEPVAVSNAFRSQIAEDNAMDIELYDFAQSLYDDRGAAGLRT